MITVASEGREDHAAVEEIVELAFGRPNEAELVRRLRVKASPRISLVASEEGRPLGHVFFSPVSIRGEDAAWEAIGLAPLAVHPEHQNRGIGSRLARAGLEACLAAGHPVVFVLGHRNYYPRFGFEPASRRGFSCEYPRVGDSFMVAELAAGALRGRSGLVRYMREFAETAP